MNLIFQSSFSEKNCTFSYSWNLTCLPMNSISCFDDVEHSRFSSLDCFAKSIAFDVLNVHVYIYSVYWIILVVCTILFNRPPVTYYSLFVFPFFASSPDYNFRKTPLKTCHLIGKAVSFGIWSAAAVEFNDLES